MSRFEARPEDYERLERCPLCGALDDAFAVLTGRGDRFEGERAVLCRRCGLVFLTPRLRAGALTRYYASDAFSREVRGSGRPTEEALAYRDMRARRRWRFLRDELPEGGGCLEIGCGAGNFLRILDENGYEATGIDPSAGYVAHASESGLDAREGRFPDDLAPASPYDLIFMFHVLEHVPEPRRMLEDVRERLAPGGLFVLEYPDVELAARRRFLPHTYFERAHLFDFSRATLDVLLARAGLAVRRTFLEERRKPYDRNVLLVCETCEPDDVDPARPEDARRLEAALRSRLRISGPLMPLRPLWRRLKRTLGAGPKGGGGSAGSSTSRDQDRADEAST